MALLTLNCFATSKRPDITMRSSLRLLARYLEPGLPTGLTGLLTHATPRSTLLALYRTTLDKLEKLPESSLYRQSSEAVTKSRLSSVESTVPAGYQEWVSKAHKVIADNPDKFWLAGDEVSKSGMRTVHIEGKTYLTPEKHVPGDVRSEEWNAEPDAGIALEGQRSAKEKEEMVRSEQAKARQITPVTSLPDEPQLTADQWVSILSDGCIHGSLPRIRIAELENSIGAGLIEEVIQVAEGELKLVNIMHENQV